MPRCCVAAAAAATLRWLIRERARLLAEMTDRYARCYARCHDAITLLDMAIFHAADA